MVVNTNAIILFDRSNHIIEEKKSNPCCQSRSTYLATAVLELASLDPVVAKGSSLGVPLQGLGSVTSTVLVVGVEDGLLLGSRKDSFGLGGTLFEVDIIVRDCVVALRLLVGEGDGVKLDGRGADLGRGSGSKDRNGGDKEGGELDHDCCWG